MDEANSPTHTARMNVIAGDTHDLAPRWPTWQEGLCGFGYWLAFVLVLEPGNILRAAALGYSLDITHEITRMLAASLLGAVVTPMVFALVRRYPLATPDLTRRLTLHLAGALGLSAGLIIASCLLAAWGFEGAWLPSLRTLQREFAANGLLLMFALTGLIAIAHVIVSGQIARVRREAMPSPATSPEDPGTEAASRVRIKHRHRDYDIDLATIDWVESQGNYVALHVGTAVHLLRETLTAFERRVDAAQFLRVHRRLLVREDRIATIKPLSNGDAQLTLTDGTELRASRSFRSQWRRERA